MAHVIDLLSLLINVFGLTGGFKRRVAIVILHLIGAYILAQFCSPVPLFLAKGLAMFLSVQFIATASPGLPKFLSFLLSLIAVILSLHLFYTSIRDFLFTKVKAQMMRKFIEYISSEISIKDATDKALSDIAKDLWPSLKYALVHMLYILSLCFLYLVNGIPVRYEVTENRREVEIKECYCKLKADQVDETYYPIYLIAAWGDSAEEISQISLCLRLPTHS